MLVGCKSPSKAIVTEIDHIFRIEQSSLQPASKLQVYQKKVNPTDEGCIVDMAHFDTGKELVLPKLFSF